MSDEQKDLARRLAAHPRFEWRPGMLALEDPASGNWQPGDYRWRIITGAPDVAAVTSEGDVHEAPYMPSAFARSVPDLADAATGGVLLDMLGPGWVTEHYTASDGTAAWSVFGRISSVVATSLTCWGATLAEACARALLAEWGANPATPETTAS